MAFLFFNAILTMRSYKFTTFHMGPNMPKKILICDDDKDFAKLLMLHLDKSGFDVALAVDGIQVMSFARKNKPDMHMPGGTAYTTVKQLEENVFTLTIPIILMSGETPDFGKLNEMYQNRFLKKPFAANKLIELINQVTQIDINSFSDAKQEELQ